MAVEYSAKGATVKPYVLTQETLMGMGRLIRAFAELEDIINLHLCNAAGITDGQLLILHPNTGISTKLALANVFAKALGGNVEKATKDCFDNEEYRALLKCRNVVAHGVLLGITDSGQIAFRTKTNLGAYDQTVGLEVACYAAHDFQIWASAAERAIPQIEAALHLDAQRAEHRARPLGGHPKAQPKREPSSGHPRQRKPPRVKQKHKPLKNG